MTTNIKNAMNQIEIAAWRGACVSVRELRTLCTDGEILEAIEQQIVCAHCHDWPARLDANPNEATNYIKHNGAYIVAVAIRQN